MKKKIQLPVIAAVLITIAVTAGMVTRSFHSTENESVEEKPSVISSAGSEPPSHTEELPLQDRKTLLLQLDAEEARNWILSELDKGTDFETGNDLVIGTDQNLASWPSYRVYLLDMLFLIDPALAAQKSRDLVESSASPDEWAVALRNVAKADGDGAATGWLQEKVSELVRNRRWQSKPSAGYLNAFDVIVHTRHTALSPDLLLLCEDRDRKAVRHAAFLSLDRLVQLSPHDMLPELADSAEKFPGNGSMISNLMARADLRDARQREALETYLLSNHRTKDELRSFANVFPNANFHISHNLLTRTSYIDGAELAERDYVSLAIVRTWLTDSRFAHIHPELERIQSRLKTFVKLPEDSQGKQR